MATYSLSKSTSAVNEGDIVTFTLTTTGVADNTQVFYIVTGVSSSDVNTARISGYFVIKSNIAVIGFNITADLLLEGTESLLLTLSNGQASISLDVIDTSTPPRYVFVKEQGTYKEIDKIFVKNYNMWFPIRKIYIKVAGIWKRVFEKVGPWSFALSYIGNTTNTVNFSNRASSTLTATFNDAAQANYFFNNGSAIRIYSSHTGGTPTPQNNAWTTLLITAGSKTFSGYWKDGFNFYNLTDIYQTFYEYSGSGVYLSNRYLIEVKSNVASNLTGTANQLIFKITFDDQHTALGGSPTDYVDGIFTIAAEAIIAIAPSELPQVVSPTYILGTIVSE